MNWYKIAQKSNIMFHGSQTPETKTSIKDFPGVYFASSPEEAKNWGKYVGAYYITTNELFRPNDLSISTQDYNIVNTFISKHGYNPNTNTLSKWKNMGMSQYKITQLSPENYWDALSNLLLFPTKEWVQYLQKLNYKGFVNHTDVFLFNPNNAQYIGQYDFKRRQIIK